MVDIIIRMLRVSAMLVLGCKNKRAVESSYKRSMRALLSKTDDSGRNRFVDFTSQITLFGVSLPTVAIPYIHTYCPDIPEEGITVLKTGS